MLLVLEPHLLDLIEVEHLRMMHVGKALDFAIQGVPLGLPAMTFLTFLHLHRRILPGERRRSSFPRFMFDLEVSSAFTLSMS